MVYRTPVVDQKRWINPIFEILQNLNNDQHECTLNLMLYPVCYETNKNWLTHVNVSIMVFLQMAHQCIKTSADHWSVTTQHIHHSPSASLSWLEWMMAHGKGNNGDYIRLDAMSKYSCFYITSQLTQGSKLHSSPKYTALITFLLVSDTRLL